MNGDVNHCSLIVYIDKVKSWIKGEAPDIEDGDTPKLLAAPAESMQE